MNHEFWNKMAVGMTEHFSKCFKERLLEILPEEMDADPPSYYQSGWNDCLAEIKRQARL